MQRLPPQAPGDVQGHQKHAFDSFTETAETFFGDKFTYRRGDGGFVGPFAALLYTPDAGIAFFEVMKALSRIPGLPQAAREVVILLTGWKWKSAYEIYAHERIAIGTDLTEVQINKIKKGQKPHDLDGACSVAFDATMELVTKMGPMSDENWVKIVKAFGQEGAAAVVHYVGFYSYTCVLCNGFNIPLPGGESLKDS